ncbi:MAG: HD domain-containing protein [Pseudomonadota bacterium]
MILGFQNEVRMEKAIRLLVQNVDSPSKSGSQKPVIAHSLRVAHVLESLGYGGDTIIIAVLHDILEKSSVTERELAQQFGEDIAGAVGALTVQKGNDDSWAKSLKLCQLSGRPAMLVRSADLYDNLCRQKHLENRSKLEKYLKKLALMKASWGEELAFEPIWRRLILSFES